MRKLLLYILCCCCLQAGAQYSFNESITPSATIQTVVAFTLTSNSSTTITFNNTSDYVSGYKVSNFNTIAVKSNMPWNFSIAAATANFTNSGTYSTANTPASILKYSIEGKTPVVQLSTTSKLLNSGTRGSAAATGNTFNVSFTAEPGYAYGPGTYTISTVYTLTAQ